MLEEDIDDTHLCIKCSATIVGLDNYVQHRKNHCSTKAANPINRGIVHIDHSYGAFDFSESSNFHKTSEEVEKGSKSLSDQYDLPYDLGADVFFSSLELQSSSKRALQPSTSGTVPSSKLLSGKVLTRKGTATRPSTSEQDDEWITTTDNSENLMKAVRDISGTKKCESLFKIIPFHHESPDPTDEEDDEEDEDEFDTQPPAETGGKWKPGNMQHETRGTLSQSSAQWFERAQWELPEAVIEEKCKTQDQEDYDQDLNPPPGHTKGKWIPGTKIIKLDYKEDVEIEKIYSDQFWCNTCNRKLASKLLYERHLKSSLHVKRSKPEKELEQASQETRTDRFSERLKRPSIFLNQEIYTNSEKMPSNPKSGEQSDARTKRFRRKTFIRCDICKTRLGAHLMGKHLISHYHYRRMVRHPSNCFDMILDNMEKIVHQLPFQCHPCRYYFNLEENFLSHWSSESHLQMVGGPGLFWCSFCKFECSGNTEMAEHLVGPTHMEVVFAINRSVPIVIRKRSLITCEKCSRVFRYNFELRRHAASCSPEPTGTASNEYQSRYFCSHCHKSCKSRLALQKHQLNNHNDRKFFCSACKQCFQTAEDIKKHRGTSEHKVMSLRSIAGELPLRKECKICGEVTDNLAALKEHLKSTHPSEKHTCPMCGKSFTLSQELSRHVRNKACEESSSHAKGERNLCNYEKRSSASKSENEPTISTDSTELQHFAERPNSSSKIWSCSICSFRSHLESEYLFHETLHNAKTGSSTEKFSCPLCGKMFRKHSLRCHLRQHTNEKIFQCEICPMKFSRKYNLKAHVQNVHQEKKALKDDEDEGHRIFFACDVCGKVFSKGKSLKQHVETHNERDKRFSCPTEACIFVGRNASALQTHLAVHLSERTYKCEFEGCDYSGKTLTLLKRHTKKHEPTVEEHQCQHCSFKTRIRGHLKRHMYIHTKEKPYNCPHCGYSCNNLENLRKHVLSTKLHPGKFLYECKFCSHEEIFKTNSQKDYRAHVVLVHRVESNLNELLSLRRNK